MLVLLFDIDGTLIRTAGAGSLALRDALTATFGINEPTKNVEIHGCTDRGITRDLFRHHGIDDHADNVRRLRAEYLRLLPRYLAQRPGRVLPGIVALLEALRERDRVLTGLLTGNTREGARLKLKHYALDHYFQLGGFGDEHHERDDVARDALGAVRRQLNGQIALDRVWVIGDTPADVRCARAIGAKALAVATGHHQLDELALERPDHLASDLGDTQTLLDLWGHRSVAGDGSAGSPAG
ncbi:MAG: HAD family hydrolase [Planctomycetaceae bacterium]